MYDSPMRYFGWYYLCNESFRTLKGFQVKSGYDTQSNGTGFRGFPTPLYLSSGQEARLWFRRPFCLTLTQVFILLVNTFNVWLYHPPFSTKVSEIQAFATYKTRKPNRKIWGKGL